MLHIHLGATPTEEVMGNVGPQLSNPKLQQRLGFRVHEGGQYVEDDDFVERVRKSKSGKLAPDVCFPNFVCVWAYTATTNTCYFCSCCFPCCLYASPPPPPPLPQYKAFLSFILHVHVTFSSCQHCRQDTRYDPSNGQCLSQATTWRGSRINATEPCCWSPNTLPHTPSLCC